MRGSSMKWMMMVGLLGSSVALAAAPAPTKEILEKGKTAYNTNCAACHGEKGDATGMTAAALNPKPRNFLTEPFKKGNKPEEVFKTVSEGLPGSTMMAFAHLAEADRWALTYYVLELQKPGSVLGGGKAKDAKAKDAKAKDAKPKAK